MVASVIEVVRHTSMIFEPKLEDRPEYRGYIATVDATSAVFPVSSSSCLCIFMFHKLVIEDRGNVIMEN